MFLNTFKAERHTDLNYTPETLQQLPCGLFRAPADQVGFLMPEFTDLMETAPLDDLSEWELDLKIHMLMPKQYPALPNWHCDNVPRVNGKTNYQGIDDNAPRMLLWVSGGPHTEFLRDDWEVEEEVQGHDEVAGLVNGYGFPTMKAPGNCWISMDQRTPHRATRAEEFTWRVFARLTHRSIAPARPVLTHMRRHCQVYVCPKTFSW